VVIQTIYKQDTVEALRIFRKKHFGERFCASLTTKLDIYKRIF